MAPRGKGAWLAALAAAALTACAAHAPLPTTGGTADGGAAAEPGPGRPPRAASPPAPAASLESSPPLDLAPSSSFEDRLELLTLIAPRPGHPRLLTERLRISGIDPHEVGQFLEAYNRRSEILQFTPEGAALAPHVLDRVFSLRPNQLLQFRFSGRVGKLVFRFTWH
jgi:hypothetical protein